jgi:Ca2+-binding EF-hand superfamily protein
VTVDGTAADPEAARMPVPAMIVAILAAAPAQVPPSAPITVTGHAWAPFISPMGEPFRARTVADDTLANWFHQADRNHDGVLTVDEMQADADRFFAKLDTDHDGEIDPDEIADYEYEIAPDVQVMSRTKRLPGEPAPKVSQREDFGDEDEPKDRRSRRQRAFQEASSLGFGGSLQGAARYGLLNMPQPVAAADTDFNRGVSLSEFRQAAVTRFQLLDRGRTGTLTLAQLQALRPPPPKPGQRQKIDEKAPDERVGNSLPPGD